MAIEKTATALIIALGLGSCVQVASPVVTAPPVVEPTIKIRHIEISTHSVPSGVCKVTYPPDPEMRDLRWVAASDLSSCQDVARDALATFQEQGWVCEEQDAAQDRADEGLSEPMFWECTKVPTAESDDQ